MIRILQKDNGFTKAIFGIIIGGAILAMVITLVPGIFQNDVTGDATVFATVHSPGPLGRFFGDSTTIRTETVARRAEMLLQQRRLPPVSFYMQQAMAAAGQDMVARAILQREAIRQGLTVSDEELKEELKTGSLGQYLFPNGQFIGKEQYMNFVEQYFHTSLADFEQQVKTDLEVQRLRDLVSAGVTVSDSAVRTAFLKEGTKVKFDYAVVSSADIKKTINPSDAELEAFFKQFAPRYAMAAPESRKIEFFTFDASNLPGGKPQVTDADLTDYYNKHRDQFKVEAQVQTRHILVSVPQGADAKTEAAAKAKAEDALRQVKSGGNFAELAKKYSDDPGSKDKGGELPMMPTTGLVPPYAQAAMALNPGQTSDLVRSQFGYHIIQTISKQPEHVKTIAEVKDQIQPVVEAQKVGSAQQAFANQLVDEAKKNGLQKTAAAHNLHLVTTDYVPQNGVIPSLADSSALLTQAFATAKGAPPASATTGEGFAIFQVDDVKPAHAPAFADIKSQVLNDYREQKAPELLNAQLTKLADRTKVLNDLKKAADEMHIPVKTSDLVTKDSQVPDLGSMAGFGSVAFTLAKGAISTPINTGDNGILLQLTDKQEPTADEIAKGMPATRERLLEEQKQELFAIYAQQMVKKYEDAGAIVLTKKPATPADGK